MEAAVKEGIRAHCRYGGDQFLKSQAEQVGVDASQHETADAIARRDELSK